MTDDTEALPDELSWVEAIKYFNETKPKQLKTYFTVQTFTNHMKEVYLFVPRRGNSTCTTKTQVKRFIAIKTQRPNWYYRPTEKESQRMSRLKKRLDVSKMLRSGVYCYD